MSLAGSSAYERKSSVDAQSENGDMEMSPFIMGREQAGIYDP